MPGATPMTFALGAAALWFVVMRLFPENLYAALGPYAVCVLVVLGALGRSRLRYLLRPSRRAVVSGVAVGAGMTLATYPIFEFTSALWPSLDRQVTELYSAAHAVPLPVAFAWVLVIIAAEEALWRGAMLDALGARYSATVAGVVSVVTYGLAQYGGGSWIVATMALACGTVWTLQRLVSRSLLAPLIAHLIWTPTVILIAPVT